MLSRCNKKEIRSFLWTSLALGALSQSALACQMPASSRFQMITLKSSVFHNTRNLRIWLPPGYDDSANSTVKYPVLYMNDGLATFDTSRVNVEGAIDQLTKQKVIPPIILVGIDNGGQTLESTNFEDDRADEFLPYPDIGYAEAIGGPPVPAAPHGKLYPKFLTEDVMPLINSKYRTKTGPEFTALGGYSYGATAAIYCASQIPQVIGKTLAESPPLWMGANDEMLKECAQCKSWSAIVHVGIGTDEPGDNDPSGEKMVNLTKQLVLSVKAADPNCKVSLTIEEGARHEDAFWARRMLNDLTILFGSH